MCIAHRLLAAVLAARLGDKTSATEGVAADAHGNVFGAETNTQSLRKYVKK